MNDYDGSSNFRPELELIIEKSPNTIVLVDKDLTLVDIIAAKDEYYRYLLRTSIGKQPGDLYPEGKNREQYHVSREAVRKALRGGEMVDFSFEVEFNGRIFSYLSQASPYKDDLAIVYTRDISSLKSERNLDGLINTILDRLPMGVFVKDAEDHFNYLYWNHFMEELTGVHTRDMEGRADFRLGSDTFMTAQERLEADINLIKTNQPIEYQAQIKAVSGEYLDIEVSKYPISLRNGKPLVLGIWRDVTSKLSVENALKRTRILSKMALQISNIRTCSIFVNPDSTDDFLDSRVRLNNWNTLTEDMIEVSWDQFSGRAHPEDIDLYRKSFTSLCRGEILEYRAEMRMLFPGESDYLWREIFATIYERDKKGRPTVILGCSTNIQQRKHQEMNLEEAKTKAEAADKMKSKYLADMSHEIRTPLTAITGFAELIAFADSEEERLSYYDVIKTNNQLLMQLINDILDISKIEAGAIKITFEPIEVCELMDTIYASARLRVRDGVVMYLEKGADHYMFGTDRNRLQQLVNNLVDNAVKNTRQGRITMGFSCLPDGQLRFYVRDTGVGIAEELLNGVFDRFVKINDYVEGIGLGLAISKGLVARMGGSIGVTSKIGEGSEFSFILPSHD